MSTQYAQYTYCKVVKEHITPFILDIKKDKDDTGNHAEDDTDNHNEPTVHPIVHLVDLTRSPHNEVNFKIS